jgi:hypothetical protein
MVRSRVAPVRDSLGAVLQRAFVVELGLVVALLVGLQAYVVGLSNVLDPYFLDSDITLSVVRGVLTLAGMGALAAAYASWRGYSLQVSLPDRTHARPVGATVAGAAVLAVVPFVPPALRAGVGVPALVSTVLDLPDLLLDRTLVRLAVFVPGMALLYHGLVQAGLRCVLDGGRTVVVTTLVGGYLVTPPFPSYGTLATGPWLHLWGARGVVAGLIVLALGVAVHAADRAGDERGRRLAMVPAVVAVAVAVLLLGTTVDTPAGVLAVGARVAVVGVAAYAYDRTRSLVAPATAYATFALVSVVLHAAAVDAVLAA